MIWVGKGGWGLGGGKFLPHPNELLIWTYPENFIKIGLMVEALDEFCTECQCKHVWNGYIKKCVATL